MDMLLVRRRLLTDPPGAVRCACGTPYRDGTLLSSALLIARVANSRI
jgi:hypothetical protein